MAQLVRDDALQLVARHRVEQPARHGNRRVLGIAAGGERVGIGIGHDVHLRLRQPRRDAHLLDDVVELAEFQRSSSARARRQRAIDGHGAGRKQHRAIAGVVARECRDAADAERRQRPDGKHELAATDVEPIEPVAEKQQEGDEHGHDRPRAPAVRGLLLEEIAGQTYFLIERSTAGTCRSAASVISKSSAGLNPSIDANMFEGNVCCAVLNLVAMSL